MCSRIVLSQPRNMCSILLGSLRFTIIYSLCSPTHLVMENCVEKRTIPGPVHHPSSFHMCNILQTPNHSSSHQTPSQHHAISMNGSSSLLMLQVNSQSICILLLLDAYICMFFLRIWILGMR